MKKIYLSKTDRKIGGVLGGIGEALGVDSTLVRLIFIFFALIPPFFPAVISYLLAWLIIPKKPTDLS